ncbi:MAG TPA: putative DNA binding domain-containing protein, partial [Thermotogota bacterium]|nr:putative DNA binding domain-containing protein [Thermotogota bacterium]
MKIEELKTIIHKDENKILEFKERFKDEILKTISAFANSSGGTLLVGVKDNGEICGTPLKDKAYQDIINKVLNRTGITPEFEKVEVDDKFVLVIEVKKSQIPIAFDGRYYKRVGNTTRVMNYDELKQFFQRDMRFERLSDRVFSFEEIDSEAVYRFITSANNNGRLTVLNKDSSVEEIFNRLSLMENGKINNAAILLFGKNPQRYFDTARVRIVHLKDNITIIGDKWASGNLFHQYLETEEAIKSYINVRYEIKGMERTDIWDYPLEAIRESVANALLHRDYFKPITTQIKVFDDKIWFFNPGGLSEDWTINRLLGLHASEPRNPIMFNIFYLAGLVESVGSGMGRILSSLKAQKFPEPEFEVNHNAFMMVFRKQGITPQDTPQDTP